MFDPDRFVADCRTASAGGGGAAVREVLARAVARPADILAALGEPAAAGVQALYRSAELTILNVVWAPLMTIRPHDHNMWAAIGIYTGREDNIFWRRDGDRVAAAGARSLSAGDVEPLGRDIVHSVTNPIEKLTGAIHVYGGDFFAEKRSEWDPETLRRQPYDMARNMRLFHEANARFHAARGA
jgi:predicted metal-dependent enzyme (double-stranded beta helix superfamily)